MKDMFDKNGVEISLGDLVLSPAPTHKDAHEYMFMGHVGGFRNGLVMVLDQDDNGFEIEPYRLEVMPEK